MKILLIHNKYKNPGGEDSVFEEECNLLREKGHEVVTYVRSNVEFNFLSVLGKIKFLFSEFFFSKNVYLKIQELCKKENPQVVHFHNTFFMISPSAYKACKDSGVRVVKTLHNYRLICPNALLFRNGKNCELCMNGNFLPALVFRCWRKSFFQTFLVVAKIIYDRLFSVYNKYVDKIIVLSQFSLTKLMHSKIDKEKFVVKPNFVDSKNGRREFVGDYIFYAGVFAEYKGVWDLVELAKDMPNVSFKLAGSGDLFEAVAKEIKQRDLTNIELLGQISYEDVNKYIQNCLCVIVPSKCYENFPRIIVESFALGVPVFAKDTPVFREIIQEESFLYYDYNDLKNKVNYFQENKQKLSEFGKDFYDLFCVKFTKERNYEVLLNIYSDVLRQKNETKN